MKRVLMTALTAAATVAVASPAIAAATVGVDVSGKPDSYQIYGITTNSPAQQVFGSSPNNSNTPNVTFTAGTAQDVSVTITNGFAQLNDANDCSKCSGADWTQIIINPDLLFTDMKFALSLTGATLSTNTVDVYALLNPALDGNVAANYSLIGTINPGAGNNINFEVSGATFNGIMLAIDGTADGSGVTLGTLKQISYEPFVGPGGVPEPSTWAMMLLGFGGMGVAMRRRRKPALAQLA
jgi:hypothetical protein